MERYFHNNLKSKVGLCCNPIFELVGLELRKKKKRQHTNWLKLSIFQKFDITQPNFYSLGWIVWVGLILKSYEHP